MIEFQDEVPPRDSYNPARVVKGPIEHVAEVLRKYAQAGCAHVIGLMPGLDETKTAKLADAARMAGFTQP